MGRPERADEAGGIYHALDRGSEFNMRLVGRISVLFLLSTFIATLFYRPVIGITGSFIPGLVGLLCVLIVIVWEIVRYAFGMNKGTSGKRDTDNSTMNR